MSIWFRSSFSTDKVNLVCFPQAGGDTGLYIKWRNKLGSRFNIVPASLPGRSSRLGDTLPSSIDNLADLLFDGFADSARGSYVLMGSSMGGWLAYEVGKRIERSRLENPILVAVITSTPPFMERKLPVLDHRDVELTLNRLIEYQKDYEALRTHPELQDVLLPAIIADFTNSREYRPMIPEPITAPIVAFQGKDDDLVDAGVMSDWEQYTTGSFHYHQIPGEHNLIQAPPDSLIEGLISLVGNET